MSSRNRHAHELHEQTTRTQASATEIVVEKYSSNASALSNTLTRR